MVHGERTFFFFLLKLFTSCYLLVSKSTMKLRVQSVWRLRSSFSLRPLHWLRAKAGNYPLSPRLAPDPVATGGCSIFRVFHLHFPPTFPCVFFLSLSFLFSLHSVWLNLNRLREASNVSSVQQDQVPCFGKQKIWRDWRIIQPQRCYVRYDGSASWVCFKALSVLFCPSTFFVPLELLVWKLNMPFHQRSVEPRRVSRLSARDGWMQGEEAGRRKLRKPVLFSSLDEVSCQTLTNIIHQLSDLSRHASDIFLGIEMEAGMVFRRSCRIQGRLQILQGEIRKLDPKKIKIRKFAVSVTCWLSSSVGSTCRVKPNES